MKNGMLKKYLQGQSLVEVVITIGIVILLLTGIVVATTSSLRFSGQSKLRSQAVSFAKEGLEVVRNIRDTSWSSLPTLTSSYCLPKDQMTLGDLIADDGSCPFNLDGVFSRKIVIDVMSIGKISVTSTVSWHEGSEIRSFTLSTYLTDWKGL